MPKASRYDALLEDGGDSESSSGWMVSYIDVMTLLVALFVLLFALSFRFGDSDAEADPVTLYTELDAQPASAIGVPLPEAMVAAMPAQRPYLNGAVSSVDPAAVVVALGVARRAEPVPEPPTPARPFPAEPMMADWQPPSSQPTPHVVAANGANLDVPLDEMVVVVTDTAPERSREVDPEAVAVATTLAETLEQRLAEAPHLPDLDGVEVSRVAEGISLRVEDNLLFSTAEAELTGGGRDVIESLVALIQRHEGDVSVEGHTDSRPINTPQFPSNWELSSARATAILRYLADEGVSPSRLRAVGFGDTRPLASNNSTEGRAKNRRVEVIIHL
ncbi:chemotaxis protein MotB [Franzmannia pantelleriensis]|uniref:Chemotaxis protein MotB n=1 Tax=Franzmannia pantelleriensis TaxID=48727 RepID=A0A1G9EJI5_9GAMM|nr:OmpA family protein [Halomonas pantelleriensis]SDK76320.1 chemotaxis protein MotB [Halomonas pantelleriensis]